MKKIIHKSEHAIQNEIQVAISKDHCRIFRANVGTVSLPNGGYFKTGLPPGYPDLHGYKQSNGKMFYIEVKNATGRPREDQIKFHKKLMADHIIHGIARSPEDALKIINDELVGYGY
ncbi:VRR-NUC domain-containing protein [Companilactobacillus allii]|uniref:VRR-NUC domain-containing protein n=1 Tax=Companilactobacillus allii TaxID=1847728 RepID=UPI001CEF5DEF|nr:VRR-NUC domain-containing protein [Companilactobacillus allii]USQ67934.1 VRR-NUC domain-containing protein [Companilactobacillus allii]